MLKKVLSAIVLIMFVTSILGFSIKPAECTTNVFSQNFDSETTGTVPQGWTVQNASICSFVVSDAAYFGSSGKSAKFTDQSHLPATSARVRRDFPNQYGTLMFSFAVMVENPDYFDIYIHDSHYADSDLHGANVYFLPDGNIGYYDDGGLHDLLQFSNNTWYEIRLVMDITKNTYDIYINGSLEARGVEFRGFGKTLYLNTIELGGQSYPMPVGYIEEISLDSQEQVVPPTTVVTVRGGLDYLYQEDVAIRLDAIVKDATTIATVSNASVTVAIYYPNGTLWVSDVMMEKPVASGIYEWESNETIHQMNLEIGVYLVQVQASVSNSTPSTDILLFHIDPASGAQATSQIAEFYYVALAISVLAGAILSAVLLKRRGKELKISQIKLA
ncbi:MAG: hypothetical protein ABSD73_02475 [Candidatus Bathyarchaeia archaeon]|jgi:hypothetical protein